MNIRENLNRDGVGREMPIRDAMARDGARHAPQPSRSTPFVEAEERSADDGPLSLLRNTNSVLKRNRIALAIWVSICIGLAAFRAWSQPPSYDAAAQLLLEPRRGAANSPRELQPAPVLDLNRADSELHVIRSERLLSEIFASLGLADDPELQPKPPSALRSFTQEFWHTLDRWTAREEAPVESLTPVPAPTVEVQLAAAEEERRRIAFAGFSERLSARRVGQSFVIEIAYTSSNPQQAARVANAAASAYLKQSVAFKFEAARSGGEFVQGRVDALFAQVQAAEAAIVAGMVPAAATPDADARVIGAALTPLMPSAPRRTLMVIFGAAVGLMSGLFAAAVAGAMDRKVRDAQRLGRQTGLSSLASVPEVRRWGRPSRRRALYMQRLVNADVQSSFSEAIRDMRAAIRLAYAPEREDGHQVIAFTSHRRDVGCSTLCMNLAHLIKRAGGAPTLIDADVRGNHFKESRGRAGGRLSSRFSYGSGALVDVLTGAARPDQLVVINVEGVALVPARSADPGANLAVDFADPHFAQILEVAVGRGDVILDLPPVMDGTDARVIARQADAVVLVVSASDTDLEEAAQAERLLRLAGARVVGVVVNRTRGGQPKSG